MQYAAWRLFIYCAPCEARDAAAAAAAAATAVVYINDNNIREKSSSFIWKVQNVKVKTNNFF